MFSDFRKRVSSAIKEGRTLSENLSNTYIRQQSNSTGSPSSQSGATPKYTPFNAVSPKITNGGGPAATSPPPFSVGCAYLAQQERTWKELHAATESNACEAERIDEQIQALRTTTDRVTMQLGDLNHSLACIPEINRQLAKCTALVAAMGDQCGRVQQSLFELEDLLEVLEVQERQLNRKFEMAMYREQKMADLEKVRQQLVVRHDQSVRQYEQQLRLQQQERQAVFQDAFQEDLRSYQALGTIPKVEHLVEQPPPLTLEEIVLDTRDDDSRRLDDFLDN